MAIPERDQLRQLVSDYYHGLITDESYREQRATLLDNIGSTSAADSDTTARRPEVSKPAAREAAVKSAAAPKQERTFPIKLVAGIATLIVVVAGAYFGLGGRDRPAGEVTTTEVREETGYGEALAEGFLSRSDWSDESLNNFLLAWEALDDEERRVAAKGTSFRRLTTRLHQRIREEVALGADPGDRQLASLTNFATAIGAPYRLSMPLDPVSPMPEELVTEDAVVAESETEAAVAAPGVSDPNVPEPEVSEQEVPAEDPVQTSTPDSDPAPVNEELASAEDDPCPGSIAGTRRPYCRDSLADGQGPALVVLPAGNFEMGSDSSDEEAPVHTVEIAYQVAMSRYEITAGEYAQFCLATSLPCPEQQWGDDAPVVDVSWDDAVLYTEWLSEATGFRYRLPTEAEWEFAARAGTTTPYFFGDEITPSAAHSSENGPASAPVSKSDRVVNQNDFKLYHMSGNVREWVQDAWRPNYNDAPRDGSSIGEPDDELRVVRGGSFEDAGTKLRSAAREGLERSGKDSFTGIRVVREISP